MKVVIQGEAERELEAAFDYYQEQRVGLGMEFLEEYRHGLEQILRNPDAWQKLPKGRRRYRLNRFPYGLIYRMEPGTDQIVISAVAHLNRRPSR